MDVNGVTTAVVNNDYSIASSQKKSLEKENAEVKNDTAATTGVVYEKSTETSDNTKKTYTKNTALVEQLKADMQAQQENLMSIVRDMMGKQGVAYATANDVWSFLSEGKFQNVSEAAKAQAQKDIAEGGYWSVEETSKRILDFADALTGGDPNQVEKMREAFKKGYAEATKAWGKDLPDISQKTYDAVMKGFDERANGTVSGTTAVE